MKPIYGTFQQVNSKDADQTVRMQAGLRLCCSQTTEDRFSHTEAKIISFPDLRYQGHKNEHSMSSSCQESKLKAC